MPTLSNPRVRYLITQQMSTIGSSEACDLRISAEEIEPSHAMIRVSKGAFLITPATRQAQVIVNGRKIKRHILSHNDEVQIGDERFIFDLFSTRSVSDEETPESSHRDQELSAYQRLSHFSLLLAEQTHTSELFEVLMDEVLRLTFADQGFLLSLSNDQQLTVRAARNLTGDPLEDGEDHMSDSVIHRVIESREPLLISDMLQHKEFQHSVSIMRLGLSSVMCVPLLFQRELLGLIYIGNHRVTHFFTRYDLQVLNLFGAQAATLLKSMMLRDELRYDNRRLRDALEDKTLGNLLGTSPVMRSVFDKVNKITSLNINVLLLGETGTGKEIIARELHLRSTRKDQPFVAINCGAIPETLMESELFGHVKGSFTGAIANKEGCFMSAHGGTLFLDEIGEMPPHLQVKLLRVLEERTITPVGGNTAQPIDIRLICATHVNLREAVAHQTFRQDLYYRINAITIDLPPLRTRERDVILIARYLIQRFSKQYERPLKPLSKEAEIALMKYSWPGNIRELENRISHALIFSEQSELTSADLNLNPELLSNQVLPLNEAKEQFVKEYIERALHLNEGNRSQTAKDLGVDPRTIYRYLEKTRSS